jgi:hypothetical protein
MVAAVDTATDVHCPSKIANPTYLEQRKQVSYRIEYSAHLLHNEVQGLADYSVQETESAADQLPLV